MKTLHLAIIIAAIITIIPITVDKVYAYGSDGGYLVTSPQPLGANNTSGIEIQNIQVEPSAIKVGDTLKITVTLVNNSPDPIFVSDSGSPDCEGPFFTVMFDNHVKIENNGIVCSYVAFEQRLDPGTKTTGTSPGLALVYTATESGTANATITFSYSDSGIEKTISKSFLFAISNLSSQTTSVIPSPLEQFKSGTSLEDIQCKNGLFLAISNEKNPLCLEPGTISKLASRGLLYGAPQDSETTILIPPGSEDPTSNKTYSPDVTTVVIGINSTITWVNQADVGNSIASDTPVVQNLNTFGGSMARPGDSYRYTFTEPGVFHYHGEPHPWQKGMINVISIPIPVNLTAQQPNTTNFPQNHTLPASFDPCQDPYPQNYTGIPVLSIPENSTGKICIRYHNLNGFAAQAGIKVSDADNLTGQAATISTWSDSENNQIPPNQDLTIVYWIKTGDRPGFYGLTMFCAPVPLAVGYGNDSMAVSDFPWVGKQFECPMLTYDYHIDSTTGIGVRYIPLK